MATMYKIGTERKKDNPGELQGACTQVFKKAQDYNREASEQVLKEIQKLYRIERFSRNVSHSPDERKAIRLEHALPILNSLGKWMAEEFKHTLSKSPMREAMQYTIPRWVNLLAYLYDGHLEIDNAIGMPSA